MKKIVLAFLFITSINSFALDLFYDQESLPVHIKEMNLTSKSEYAYSFVLKHCHDPIFGMQEIYKNSWKETSMAIGLVDKNAIKRRRINKGQSEHLKVLLDSYGFYLGMDDCFGSDMQLRKDFGLMLISSEAFGTLTGGALGTLSWIFSAKMFVWAGSKLGLTAKVIKKLSITFGLGAIGTGGAYGVYKIYQNYLDREEMSKKIGVELQDIREEIKNIERDLAQIIEMLDNPEDLTNEELSLARELKIEMENQRVKYLEKEDGLRRI